MAKSWVPVPPNSDFSLGNIPFGIVSRGSDSKRVPATIIGDHVLDLSQFSQNNGFSQLSSVQNYLHVFQEPTLNGFARLGQKIHREVRIFIQQVLSEDTAYPGTLRDNEVLKAKCLIPVKDVKNHLPMGIGDFTDFYGGMNHAINAGALVRGQNGALLPNFLHMPMAYHSRSSSVYVSGTPIKRPWGQLIKDVTATPKVPVFEICQTLDFELELGAFVCGENAPGQRISIDTADQNIFGYVLVNDWSARDVQRWEYVPLGPFNGKNFATSISPWVVLKDALEPFRAEGLPNKEKLLPYLSENKKDNVHDLNLEVVLTSGKTGKSTVICRTNAADGLVWSFQQMLAHHTVTGCPMRAGDLLASGTISGPRKDSLGCLLEKTLNGKEHISLEDGEQRIWLEDGDSVTLRGYAGTESSGRVGFGECVGQVIPADSV
ncbi:fumarylacetoacetase [Xylogone sp. PMI_703]|nr:fumarylacetoacetase [Xylogone sp. PMI_703]